MQNLMKRYTVINSYIGGSNILPQTLHGINDLWLNYTTNKFSKEASKNWIDWANHGKTEVVLTGLDHAGLEKMYECFSKFNDIPIVKFNESMEAMNGCCTIVSFVVSENIVSAGFYARNARLNPYNIAQELKNVLIPHCNTDLPDFVLTEEEIEVVSQIAFLPTVRI